MEADTLLPVVHPALPGWESWPLGSFTALTYHCRLCLSVLHYELGAGAHACLSSAFPQPSVAECPQHLLSH